MRFGLMPRSSDGANTFGAYINHGKIIQAIDAEKNLSEWQVPCDAVSILTRLCSSRTMRAWSSVEQPIDNRLSEHVHGQSTKRSAPQVPQLTLFHQSDIVRPEGFIIWSASDPRVFPNITHFAEYTSFGPGYTATARNTSIETILTADQAQQYTLSKVFGSKPTWIDYGTAVGMM